MVAVTARVVKFLLKNDVIWLAVSVQILAFLVKHRRFVLTKDLIIADKLSEVGRVGKTKIYVDGSLEPNHYVLVYRGTLT
jgi:hypothetical protein